MAKKLKATFWSNPSPMTLMTAKDLRLAAGYAEKGACNTDQYLAWLKQVQVKPAIIETHGSKSRVYVRRDEAAKFLASKRLRNMQKTLFLRAERRGQKELARLAASTAANPVQMELPVVAPVATTAVEAMPVAAAEPVVIAESRHEPATVTFVERLARLEEQNKTLLNQVERLVQMWS